MSVARIRKLLTIIAPPASGSAPHEAGATRRAAAIAVIENPCRGEHLEDLALLGSIGNELAGMLGLRAAAVLGLKAAQVASYGKAAIIGEDGDLEHATAMLHPQLLGPARAHKAACSALVPSARKVGGLGTLIEVPLGRKQINAFGQCFEVMAVQVADAPHPHEILVAVAVTDRMLAPPHAAGTNVVSFFGARRRWPATRLRSIS
jgi:hypothetical protein